MTRPELSDCTPSGVRSEESNMEEDPPKSPSASMLQEVRRLHDASTQSIIPTVIHQQAQGITAICGLAISELEGWQKDPEPPDETVNELIRNLKDQSRKVQQLHANSVDKTTWTSEQFTAVKEGFLDASEQCNKYVSQGRAYMEDCEQRSQDGRALVSEQPSLSKDKED